MLVDHRDTPLPWTLYIEVVKKKKTKRKQKQKCTLFIEKKMYLKSRRTCSQQNIVRMPVDGSNSGANWFFDMLRNPPIIFLFEITNRNKSCSRSNCKLVFLRTPFDTSCCPIDSEIRNLIWFKNFGRLIT